MESAIELAIVKVLGVGKVAGTGFFVSEENIKTEVEVWYPVDSRKTIEDIAVLKLIEQPPEIVRPIVLVSSAEELGDHEFKTFGFPPNNLVAGFIENSRIQTLPETG
jgi:hypothetical protein